MAANSKKNAAKRQSEANRPFPLLHRQARFALPFVLRPSPRSSLPSKNHGVVREKYPLLQQAPAPAAHQKTSEPVLPQSHAGNVSTARGTIVPARALTPGQWS